jgi:hypothetical protein
VPAEAAAEMDPPPVEDELAARRRRTVARRDAIDLVVVPDRPAVADEDSQLVPTAESEALRTVRRAKEELALAEAAHWQAEFELADAEGAVDAAEDRPEFARYPTDRGASGQGDRSAVPRRSTGQAARCGEHPGRSPPSPRCCTTVGGR